MQSLHQVVREIPTQSYQISIIFTLEDKKWPRLVTNNKTKEQRLLLIVQVLLVKWENVVAVTIIRTTIAHPSAM